jgi:hypothetical protein
MRALGEEVSGVLITNIAQRARLIGTHTAGCEGFDRGYSLVHGRPTKILILFFSLCFPQFARLKGRIRALELQVISRSRGVHFIGYPFPLNMVIFIFSEVYVFDKVPKLDKFNKLLPWVDVVSHPHPSLIS